jgi:hypothetical protein
MRLKRHIAALALACAGACGAAGAGPAPDEAPPGASIPPPPAPVRMPEINVLVSPPGVTVDVDTPALHITPHGEWSVHTDGLPELKRRLDRGEWRAALDLIQGPLRARLTRDPRGGFRMSAQSAPGPGPAPTPAPPPQPGQPPQPNNPNANGNEQQRMLDLYRAQLGGRVQMQKGAFLGVSTSPVPDALRHQLGLPEGVGLVVEVVEKDSPAEKAGLKQYDILNKLDDQLLVNAEQLAVLIRAHKGGETVKLSITRGGKEQSVPATLIEKDVKPLGDSVFWQSGGGPADLHVWSLKDAAKDRAGDQAKFKEFNFVKPDDLDRANKEAGRRKGAMGGRDKSTMVLTDDDYQLVVTGASGDPNQRHLSAVERKTGKVVYNGGTDDDARKQMPPPVAERLKQLDEAGTQNGKGRRNNNNNNNNDVRIEKRFGVTVDRPGKPPKPEKDKPGKDKVEKEKFEKDKGGDKRPDRDHDAEDEVKVEIDNDSDTNDTNDDDHDGPGQKRSADAAPTIRPDDVIEVSISDLQAPGVETVKRARVRDGALSLPYIGPVKVEGLTERQIERRIVKNYADANLVANVNVQVKRVADGEVEVNVAKP